MPHFLLHITYFLIANKIFQNNVKYIPTGYYKSKLDQHLYTYISIYIAIREF